MESDKVIVNGVDRNHRRMILNLLRERICEPRKAPHAQASGQRVFCHRKPMLSRVTDS
jgi:hypothetical protein